MHPMTPEQRAAAERFAIYQADPKEDDMLAIWMHGDLRFGRETVRRDVYTLADYALSLMAEGGELVTEEWLRSIGFVQMPPGNWVIRTKHWGHARHPERHTQVCYDDSWGELSTGWFVNGLGIAKLSTRSEVLSLLRALKIEVKHATKEN